MLKALRKPDSPTSACIIWFVIYAFLLNVLSTSFFTYVKPAPIPHSVSLMDTLMGLLVSEARAATDTVKGTIRPSDSGSAPVISGNNLMAPAAEGGGTIAVGGGAGSVNSVMGAYGYSYPILVPEGRGGLTPALALAYSSMGGTSWFGMGWDLALGSIERKTKERILTYDDNDIFVITLKGIAIELVREDDEYRLKDEGLFLRIFKEDNSWRAVDKSGTTYYFGNSDNSRQAGAGGTFQWRLDRMQDADGNYMTIDYFQEGVTSGGALYPQRIDYAGHINGQAPTYSVYFYRELRPDPQYQNLGGTRVTLNYRIQSIVVRYNDAETIRAYKLHYNDVSLDAPLNTSYLEQIEMYGSDAELTSSYWETRITGGTALPPTVFEYTTAKASHLVDMEHIDTDDSDPWCDKNIWPLDFNGDGHMDLFTIREHDDSYWQLYEGHDGQFTRVDSGTLLNGKDVTGSSLVIPGDYNGDGKTDIVLIRNKFDSVNNFIPNQHVFYAKADGTGFGPPNELEIPGNIGGTGFFGGYGNRADLYPADLDGDGRTDLMMRIKPDGYALSRCNHADEAPCTWATVRYMSTNNGLEPTHTTRQHSAPPPLCVGDFNGDGISETLPDGYLDEGESAIPVDINSDGRTDFMKTSFEDYLGYKVLLSTGDDFVQVQHMDFPHWDDVIHFGDFNGDGLPDMLTTAVIKVDDGNDHIYGDWSGYYIYPGTGKGFDTSEAVYHGSSPGWSDHVMVGDFDHDGRAELYVTDIPAENGRWSGMKKYRARTHIDLGADDYYDPDTRPRLLGRITNSMGAVTEISYTPSTTWQDEEDTMPIILPTVNQITISDGTADGHRNTTLYRYENPHYDLEAKEFRGFEKVTVKDPATMTTAVNTHHVEDPRFQGRIKQSVTYSSTGSIVVETRNDWEATVYQGPGNGAAERTFAFVRRNTTLRYDDNQNPLTTVTTQYQYDAYGNITHEDMREINHATGIETTRYTFTAYQNYSDNEKWILGKPLNIRIDTTDPGPSQPGDESYAALRETRMTYDPLKPWQLESSARVVWQDLDGVMTENEITTHFAYDDYGNTTWISNPRSPGWGTTTDYSESDGLFPNWTTNAAGHQTHRIFDPRLGKVVKEVVNAQVGEAQSTTFVYDVFGRADQIIYPDNSTETYTYHIEPPSLSGTGSHYIQVARTLQPTTTTYYDNLNRVIQTQVDDGINPIYTETLYDDFGRVWKTSLPHFGSDAPQYNVREYDFRGRIQRQINPDGTARTIEYLGLDQILTDEKGYEKRITKDSLGRLTKVEEASGGITEYEYDLFGNLIWIQGPLGNQTHIYYDGLGRKISMDDPYMGHWEYRYDAAGNLVWQQDGENRIVEMTYDAINRIQAKDYQESNRYLEYIYGESRTNYYNAAGLTRLITTQPAQDRNVITYDYDLMGRTVHETREINGVTYHISRDHDQAGRVRNLYYPNNSLRIEYDYHPMGQLRSVEKVEADTTRTALAFYEDYTALGQMQNITFGNGAVTEYVYHPDHHRLENLVTRAQKEGSYQAVQDLIYDFDPVGNVTSINDRANGVHAYFDYDELHRLTHADASCPGDPVRAYRQAYTYDLAGNMTEKTGLGAFRVAAWQDAQRHIRPAAVNYGPNTAGVGERQIQYDQDNKPSVITYQGETSHLYYDGNGTRVRKANNGQSDIYVGGIYEIRDGQVHLNIFANGKRLATMRAGQAYYSHGDHLGSTSLVTNAAGQVVEEIGYLPFGATLFRNTYESGVWTSSYRFTGQEYDAEYALYNYNARLYDPVMGRFITADTIVPDWTDPQSLNRYSYCRNNPLKYVDPSGHFDWAALGLAVLYGALIGAAVGGLMALQRGGDVWEGIRGGAISGAISGALFYCAGSGIESFADGLSSVSQVGYKAAAAGIHTATGATAGAINAAMTGGDIAEGAFIGGLSAGAAELMGGGEAARLFTGAAAGGVSSVMVGGDFAQGAVQGAMTSAIADICNRIAHKAVSFSKLKRYYQQKDDMLKGKIFHKTAIDAINKGGSCAARLSNAYNRAGSDLLDNIFKSSDITTVGDGLGNRYVLGANDLARAIGLLSQEYRITDLVSITGKTGVILFSNYHIDLWDANSMVGNGLDHFVDPEYTSRAMYFMELK